MYGWLRRGLFTLPPETAHEVALNALALGRRTGLTRLIAGRPASAPRRVFGLDFPNPVGLSAGLDKNGDYIDALGALGFGFIEVGTVTPEPQPGNKPPRMFRLPEYEALINRLGFNNKGVDHLVRQLERRRWNGITGVNIGKQKTTPIERAADDYRACMEKVYRLADYITVNISSPNTENLRQLQDTGPLTELLAELVGLGRELARIHGRARPLLIKIAPDWDDTALRRSLEVIGASGVDGLIATNTTVARDMLGDHRHAGETGGLSGGPVRPLADATLETCREVLGGDFPLVGVGGITRGEHAAARQRLGAGLVQLYTGFIYHGPRLIGDCVEAMSADAP